ncbi:MAG: hypoxanthine phosphoribosyltransferase [Lachnospiraceae bacterium]|nr:hypoxanthine phosphoribosyltransferase [Lachnospiraceae bacterium]
MKEVVHEMFSEEQIEKRIAELAEQISRDYSGKKVRMVCILRGSVFFFTELAKRMTIPVTIDFMAASSYGDSTDSSGSLEVRKDLDDPLDDLDVLVIEDIIDTGTTLRKIKKMLMGRNAASLKVCTLLDKPARRETEVEVEYIGFTVPDEFIVGYGLDYAQRYRNLPYIGRLEFIEE